MNTAVVVVIVVVVVVLLMVLLSPKDKSEGVAVLRKKGPLGRIADVVGKATGKKPTVVCPRGYRASTDGKYCIPLPPRATPK